LVPIGVWREGIQHQSDLVCLQLLQHLLLLLHELLVLVQSVLVSIHHRSIVFIIICLVVVGSLRPAALDISSYLRFLFGCILYAFSPLITDSFLILLHILVLSISLLQDMRRYLLLSFVEQVLR